MIKYDLAASLGLEGCIVLGRDTLMFLRSLVAFLEEFDRRETVDQSLSFELLMAVDLAA